MHKALVWTWDAFVAEFDLISQQLRKPLNNRIDLELLNLKKTFILSLTDITIIAMNLWLAPNSHVWCPPRDFRTASSPMFKISYVSVKITTAITGMAEHWLNPIHVSFLAFVSDFIHLKSETNSLLLVIASQPSPNSQQSEKIVRDWSL